MLTKEDRWKLIKEIQKNTESIIIRGQNINLFQCPYCNRIIKGWTMTELVNNALRHIERELKRLGLVEEGEE